MNGAAAPSLLAALASLAAVILLILLAARAARLLPALRQMPAAPDAPALRGTLALDARRRLHLVQAGGHQALVLTGGVSDVVAPLPPAP